MTAGVPIPVPVAAVDGARIYHLRADTGADAVAAASAVLTPDENAKAATIIHPEARSIAFLARAFLRTVLAHELARAPSEIGLATLPDGKPILANEAADGLAELPLQFNLAHSANAVLIGIADTRPVGIDIEVPRPISDLEGLATSVLTVDEMAALSREPDRHAAFLRLWCAKEAVMKADGRGFRLPPEAIALNPTMPDGTTSVLATFAGPLSPLPVHPLEIPGAVAALAIPAANGFTRGAGSLR